MCCGIFGQGVKALSLDMNPYQVEKPHLVVVRFILRRGQTNVEIEIREFEGGVRATGLLCLLGVGVGLCTFLAYKLCSQLKYLISSSSVDNNSLQLSCLPSPNTQVLDSGISLGIKKLKKPGILHRSQLLESQPQIWRKRIIDWLARSSFPSEGGESEDEEEDDEYKYESDQTTHKLIKVKKFDPMMTSTQSGWSSGFVSNPDNAELSWNNNSFQYEGSKEWQSYGNEDELMDGIEEESEGHVSNQSQLGCNTNHHQIAKKNVPKYRRLGSGLSSSSSGGVRVGNKYGMKRNCYSFASCKSGDSSLYDYRDSLVSKGFSVDLGENLDAVIFPSNCEFVPSDQLSAHDDQGAVNHMDWLQYELMKIQLDIDCLNQKFDDLCQPKMNESKHQIPEDFLTEKFQNAHPVDPRIQTPHEGTPDVETFDFIWDYHSDLAAVEQPSFISSRPGGDSFNGNYEGSVFEDTGRFKMTQGIIDEEDDDDELVNDPLRDEIENASGLKGRRESIVLFYFDDDIDDGFMGIQRPHSISNTSNQANIPQLNKKLSDNSSKNELQKSKCVSSSLLPSLDRIFQSGSPRHLKRSKAEQQTNINNNTCCIERIFSCEDRRIVGDEKKLFEHLESDLHVDVTQISNIRKGYSKVFELWGSSNVRSFRSERFSILGPITFHVLLHGLPILSDVGGNFQNSVQYLVAAIDNDHQYLMEWKYKGFLWAPKNEVLFKLINSLRIFCEQVCAVRRMMKKCREQYLVSLLNHSTDMEVHLVEALKIVIMLKVISLCKVTHKHPNLEELFGSTYASAELVFKNLINNVEDGTIFDDLQMSFLSAILGVRLEILSPTQCGSEGFMRSYPTMLVRDSNRWNKLSIIEDGPAFLYCLPALNNDE